MTKRHYQLLTLLALVVFAGVTALHGQPPPPPPPPDQPPCWPPPCIPVDGGIIFAVGAAAIFGGKKIYRAMKSGKGE
jgi:hypothetical protein